jgi:hypothetical protein
MPTDISPELTLDEEITEYLSFAMAVSGGFSKGTANVSPNDVKKLHGLMAYYAKKAHPFTECVRDNRKRFGPLTEKYCAVLKDLIEGNTKWRKGGNKSASGAKLSDQTLHEIFGLDLPDGFGHWLSELTEEDIEAMLAESDEDVKEDEVTLSEEDESDNSHILAEMYFADAETKEGQDGLIWKTVLREGVWKFSPGSGQKPVDKPITVVKNGESDPRKMIVSMAELKRNFEAGAVEHVTVPTSHADKVLENTGYVRRLRWGKDAKGRAVLQAGLDFTEPDVKEKALRGTIANTSGGILFDYAHKESGNKFNAVLAHVALTNHPWLNGMQPFGVEASEDLNVISFSENPDDSGQEREGGTDMPEVEATDEKATFLDELGLSEEDVRAAVEENKRLKAEARQRDIDTKVQKWSDEKKSPAMVTEAKALLSASDDSVVLNLSEDGKDVGLSAADIVERLMEKAPTINLSQDVVTDQDVTGEKDAKDVEDENDEANLSQDEKSLATLLFYEEGYSEKDAVAEAKKRLAKGE